MEKRYYFDLEGVTETVDDWVNTFDLDLGIRVLDPEKAIQRVAEALGSGEIEDWEVWQGGEDILDRLGIEWEKIE